MTDREPDKLYDALRDRLADYGQEPPAPLWANIRAQLPPPVAAPQRRSRSRRRVALLALLLLLVSVSSWQGWRRLHAPGASRPEVAAQPSAARPAGRASGPAASETATTTTQSDINQFKSVDSGEIGQSFKETSTASQYATTTPKTAETAGTATDAAVAKRQGSRLAGRRGRGQRLGRAVASASRRSGWKGTSPVGDNGVRAGASAGFEHPDAESFAVGTESNAARTTTAGSQHPSAARLAAKALPSTTASLSGDLTAQSRAIRGQEVAVVRAATQPAQPSDNQTSTSAQQLTSTNEARNSLLNKPSSPESWSQLTARQSALVLATWPGPVVTSRADTVPALLVGPPPRWAVQLLSGPALTYRQLPATLLESATTSFSAAPIGAGPASPTNVIRTNSTTSVEEKPAGGLGIELQVRRVLNGRWAASSGLGYHTYAVGRTVQVQTVSTAIPPVLTATTPRQTVATTSYQLRDTYRFLTVPLRLSYQLTPGSQRFGYALLGGADLALYLGGATAEGTSTTTQSRSAGNGPFQPLSLALSFGAEVRYRLAPRWQLLAQPTGTYFATPLVRPVSGYAPRKLLGGSALLGISYWLK